MNRPKSWSPAWLVLTMLLGSCVFTATAGAANVAHRGVPLAIDSRTIIDVNNIEMFVTNTGSLAYDLETGDAGCFFPRGTDKTILYAAGMWFGSSVGDDVRVTVAEYSMEYQPGRILIEEGTGKMTAEDPADSRQRVYKLSKDDFESPDYLDWPVDFGAPVDEYGAPLLIGDQTLWSVYNDVETGMHTNSAGNTPPQNIEVHQTTFGFDRPAPLGNMIFLKYTILNQSPTETLENCYVSFWADPDVGGMSDDLVGCDTDLSLGYCYNATNEDELYGSTPPAIGFDFFQGPIVYSPGDVAYVSGVAVPDYRNLPMTSFNKYINGTDPMSAIESYNYMRGLNADGSAVIDQSTGVATTYMNPGDPVNGTGWLDDDPADRRCMLSAGPFTMAPGESQEVVVGIIVAQGSDRLSSVALLKLYDEQAQAVFDVNFQIPPAPPRPALWVRPYDQAIDLIWSTDAMGNIQLSDALGEEYHHQGYNLYQGASLAGPWKKIMTWDVEDDVSLIYAQEFDVDAGGNQQVIRQRGPNRGLAHQIRLEQDYIKGGPLRNYKEYYYTVTSYSHDVMHMEPVLVGQNQVGWLTPSLENSPQGVVAVPKASAAVLEAMATHESGSSDGAVSIAYVVQEEILPHNYRVTFRENPDEETSAGIPYVWSLTDLMTEEVLLEDQIRQTEDFDDPVVNGFIPNVKSPPLTVKGWDWLGETMWLAPLDWGGTGFGGGVGLAGPEEFFGSTLGPADYGKTIEIRFTSDTGEWSECAVYRRDYGFDYDGVGAFPGSIWDVTGGIERRLNICFAEDNDEKPANLHWDPDDSELGGREYLFIMNSDYNGAVDYGNETEDDPRPWGPMADVIFGCWFYTPSENTFLECDATFILEGNRINTANDVFEFSTYPAGEVIGTVIDNDLDKIRVVPNPYLNQSKYELNQFDRIVKFINLPSVDTTIRIFTLGGELVRSFVKDDPVSSTTTWDLENSQGIPVASGVYIYHVEAEGIGTEVGKMVVFVEKERLNRF